MIPSANIRQSSLAIKKNGAAVSDYVTNIKYQESNSRIANPASLPTDDGRGVALTPDGTVMAVAHDNLPYVTTYMSLPFTQITFNTSPALDDVITADYTVDGVHKTDQYVIDVSFAIQFGEGV